MEYDSPLANRYASKDMVSLFTELHRAQTWRKVWVALAQSEQEMGLPVTCEQVEELRAHQMDVPLERAHGMEKKVDHDVLAHIAVYGEQCPKAKQIIHLGATSCDITDNGDLLIYKEALLILQNRFRALISSLASFAKEHAALPVLGYTHFQPAQPTTLGMRACLWLQDIVEDAQALDHMLAHWRLRGLRGATGSQSSYLSLFDGNKNKVQELEQRFIKLLGEKDVFPVSGQTYPRKFDAAILRALSSIGESVQKFGTDIRLLQHTRELQEPFGSTQKGSSAMPYKRNPMKAERLCSLGRLLMNHSAVASQTAAQQWLERSLDDSAARRIVMAEAFMAAESVLALMDTIVKGLVVNTSIIEKRLQEELPFFATENILMHCTRHGGDRQELHTHLRDHAQAAAEGMKHGAPNDLFQRISADKKFGLSEKDLRVFLDVNKYTGRCKELVEAYLAPLKIEKTVQVRR